MTDSSKTILLVDDEEHFRERLGRAMEKRGYEVLQAGSYDEALPLIRTKMPPLAVFDLRMPGPSGLELVKSAIEINPDMRIIIFTGYGSIATATEAIRLGATNYLPKPADTDDILAAFTQDLDKSHAPLPSDIETPSLGRVEWEHINRVLTDCGGNISAAAKRLNIHRRTLQRKLLKYPPYQ